MVEKNLASKNGVDLRLITPNLSVGQGSIEDTPKEVGHNMLELGKTAVLSVAEFAVLLKAELEKHASEYGVKEFNEVTATKPNIGKVDGLTATFEDNSNIRPTVYPSTYYEDYKNGKDISEISENILKGVKSAHDHTPDFSIDSVSRESAQDHLYIVLLNKEMNSELAEKCPSMDFQDLVAIPRWKVSDKDGQVASMAVTHDLQANLLHMTDEEILDMAKKNTIDAGFVLKGMSQVMREMISPDVPEEIVAEMVPADEMMYVLTNESKMNGATALLDKETLASVKDTIGEETYYVIPSSIHEVLIVPESKISDPADLKQMCKEVNATQVALDEQLGENIYRYDGKKLSICNSLEELKKQTLPQGMKETADVTNKITNMRRM